MATSPLGGFADLSSARRRVDAAIANDPGIMGSFGQGIEQGLGLVNLPQTIQQTALNKELELALQQAKLRDLQRGKPIEVGGSLIVQDPITGEYKSVFTAPSAIKQRGPIEINGSLVDLNPETGKYEAVYQGAGNVRKPIEIGSDLVELNPLTGKYESVYQGTPKSPFTQQQVVSLTDPSDVRFALPDASGQPPAGYQFSKAMEAPMKPSDKISAMKDLRQAHGELQSKLLFFGKGEVPGVYGIKKKLDAVLKPVNFDFSKLNPQAKQGFVFAANKLRDPTSATLLAEARQIADRAGVLDRFNAFVAGYKEGDPLPDQVAKDIYQVVTQTNDLLRSDYLDDLPYYRRKTSELGESIQALSVPKSFIDELEADAQLKNKAVESSVATPTDIQSPVGTPGINPNARSPVTPSDIRKKFGW